jgi:hypothetical protein
MKTGLKRDPIDKFYTHPHIAKICCDYMKKYVKENDLCIEPSAGSGSFIPFIKKLSKYHKYYDIKPENPKIIKKDFLKLKLSSKKVIHVIGNPPFGRRSSTAIKFIKHCAELKAQTIAFILPISFKKDLFKKAFPLNYHLKVQKDLPEYSFIYDNKPYNVKCIWQIWERKDIERKKPLKHKACCFSFVKKPDCEYVIRRVGHNVGKTSRCSKTDNTNTNWFIKMNNGYHNIPIMKLNNIKYNITRNVGPNSISKQEIIKKYNKVLTHIVI